MFATVTDKCFIIYWLIITRIFFQIYQNLVQEFYLTLILAFSMPSVFIFQWSIGMQNMLLMFFLFIFVSTECQRLIFAGCALSEGWSEWWLQQRSLAAATTRESASWSPRAATRPTAAGSVTTRPRVTPWRGGLSRRWSVWSVISGRRSGLTARPRTASQSSELLISVLSVNYKISITLETLTS